MCLLILFNTGGYYLVYFQVQSYFKSIASERITEYIPVESLTLLRFSTKYINSETQENYRRINKNEVSYNGNMYDIYKEEVNNDSLILYCLSDENEDKLDQAFSEYINKNVVDYFNLSVKNLLRAIIKIALPPVEFSYNDFSLYNLIAFKSNKNDLINVIIDVPVPPPRKA